MTSEDTTDISELDEIDVVSTDTKSPPGLLQSQAINTNEETQAVQSPLSEAVPTDTSIKSDDCYCKKAQDVLAVWCEKCKRNFHIECLKSGNPSPLDGDNFFRFTCSGCSENKTEVITRIKLTWQQVVILALYNLGQRKSGRKGFFRWKEDVCEFISTYWSVLFGQNKNRSQTWHGTVAGVLSSGSKTIFRSGAPEFGEPGWWTLLQNKPPSYKPEQIGKEALPPIKVTAAQRKSKLMTFEPTIKVEGLRSRKRGTTAVESAMELKEKRSRTQEAKEIRKARQASVEGREGSSAQLDMEEGSMDSFTSSEFLGAPSTPVPDSPSVLSLLGGDSSCDSFSLLQESDLATDESLPSMLMAGDEEELGPPSKGLSTVVRSPTPPANDQGSEGSNEQQEEGFAALTETKKGSKAKGKQTAERLLAKSVEKPKYLPMSIYEERQLLKLIQSCPEAVENDPVAKRFRRKLLVRQEKRERGLPLFDLDSAVQQILQKSCGISPYPYPQAGLPQSPIKQRVRAPSKGMGADYRILDRFQVSSQALLSPKRQTGSFRARLVGSGTDTNFQKIVSPYTARILKPYIRRDYDSKPQKLKLLEEITRRRVGLEDGFEPPPTAPIDYCYVSPHHIPSINALCGEFFWPGIDLSECLQYPDFSVVVLYRKVVIGFGFMVPDVKYNEAYISFLFVHPEWRNAGIGTFMVYHLIQTCMGKDVTLHVSATNSAMLLYQKFGFKPEEFILDFYEKYYPEESSECRHAFVLRLRR